MSVLSGTKVIIAADQNKGNCSKSQLESKVNTSKLPEARENACDDWFLLLNLIGWESDENFLDQSQSKVK